MCVSIRRGLPGITARIPSCGQCVASAVIHSLFPRSAVPSTVFNPGHFVCSGHFLNVSVFVHGLCFLCVIGMCHRNESSELRKSDIKFHGRVCELERTLMRCSFHLVYEWRSVNLSSVLELTKIIVHTTRRPRAFLSDLEQTSTFSTALASYRCSLTGLLCTWCISAVSARAMPTTSP